MYTTCYFYVYQRNKVDWERFRRRKFSSGLDLKDLKDLKGLSDLKNLKDLKELKGL